MHAPAREGGSHRNEWTALHARLHVTLRRRHLLRRHQRLLVAVSGGQDSLCLMQLLLDLQPKWQWHLAIAHCNHRWCPEEDALADYVDALAQRWEAPCHRVAAEQLGRSEAAARTWRYQELVRMAEKFSYDAVLTAHTASDRAETLLYHLIRGSGLDGLSSLTWMRELAPGILLIRPLLEFTRSETGEFCRSRNLVPHEDPFNQDRRYTRSRIRHDLIPHLKDQYNPQVERVLNQTADLLQAEVDYLSAQADALFQQAIAPESRMGDSQTLPSMRLRRDILAAAPKALQRRALRHCLKILMTEDPTFEHVEKLTALITAPNRTQTDPFPGEAIARVEENWIVFAPGSPPHR